MMTRMRRGVLISAGALAVMLGMLVVPTGLDAQARRDVTRQNRQSDVTDQRRQRQGQLLLDRFAQRVAQALDLSEEDTQRLLREMQATRAERGRLRAQEAAVRRELAQLIREEPADEVRIESLMSEALDLDVARAEVAIDEQRRLAEFLSPLERARLIWFQQQATREALRRRTDGPLSR